MRPLLFTTAMLFVALAATPTIDAGQPCTTPPKTPVESIVWAASCAAERLPDPEPLVPETTVTEIDLRWMTACPGPWGHEERTDVGPIVIVTYVCDDGGT